LLKARPSDDYGSDNSLFDGPYDPSQQTPLPPRTQLGHSSQATLVGTVPPYGVPPRASIAPPNVQEPSPRRQQPARPKRMSVAHPIDPPKQTAAPETPYRSTRARSGSLTPYADDPNAIIRKNRQKGRKKTLETLDERRLEEEREALSREPEGNAETQEVADLLMAANDQSGISDGGNTVDDLDHMPPPRSTTRRAAGQPTLETDDAQTDQALRRPQVPLPSAREILKSLGGPRLSRQPESVTSKAPSVSSPRLAQNSPPDVFMASSRRQGPIIDLSSPFYSQSAAGRSSVSRKSSSDSFPINGTRAKKVKQEIKKQEKHTPYRPPAGTRAEDVLKSR
jgi:hypothetical protein